MQQIELQAGHQLGQIPGFIAIGSLGAVMLGISLYSRAKLVKNTHDFVIVGVNPPLHGGANAAPDKLPKRLNTSRQKRRAPPDNQGFSALRPELRDHRNVRPKCITARRLQECSWC